MWHTVLNKRYVIFLPTVNSIQNNKYRVACSFKGGESYEHNERRII